MKNFKVGDVVNDGFEYDGVVEEVTEKTVKVKWDEDEDTKRGGWTFTPLDIKYLKVVQK